MASQDTPPVLILAHTPPPLHGQSLMVAQMLDALRQDPPIPFLHIDCRYSSGLGDLGRGSLWKGFLALLYVARALWLRLVYGIRTLYYIPAPPKRAAVWRDWLVLGLLRPFFAKTIFHWHALGLPGWLAERTSLEQAISAHVYRNHDVALSLLEANRADAAAFAPRKIEIVPNGIPDPCPRFATRVLPHRRERAARLALFPHNGETLRLLFLSAATRGKGLFDALEAWRLANLALAETASVCSLSIAGTFTSLEEEDAFRWALAEARAELQAALGPARAAAAEVRLLGHVEGEEKEAAFLEGDLFLFPSSLPWESFGLAMVEAAHYGLPCLATQPLVGEGLGEEFHFRLPPRDPAALAAAILAAPRRVALAEAIRAEALAHFSPEAFGRRIREVLAANIV